MYALSNRIVWCRHLPFFANHPPQKHPFIANFPWVPWFWFRHERANLFGRCQSWTHKENLQDTLQHIEQFKSSFLLFYCQEWSLVQAVSFAVYKVRPICRVSDSGIGCCNWAITSGPGIRICARWTNRVISAFDLPHIFSAVYHIANNNVYNPVVLTVHSLTSCNS